MVGSVEVSIIVWSIYITLKLFWKTFENGIIRGPLFHSFHHAFDKHLSPCILQIFCDFSVLK